MSATPWPTHRFQPTAMTPLSCMRCGRSADHANHLQPDPHPKPSTEPDFRPSPSGNVCNQCGGTMVRTGSCETCTSCGNNTGCG